MNIYRVMTPKRRVKTILQENEFVAQEKEDKSENIFRVNVLNQHEEVYKTIGENDKLDFLGHEISVLSKLFGENKNPIILKNLKNLHPV